MSAGSTSTGKLVMTEAARNLTPRYFLELEEKSNNTGEEADIPLCQKNLFW